MVKRVVSKIIDIEEEKKKKTLDLSIKEGSATAFMSSAGETYIVPYALALNANNLQIGFLTSFVNLFGSSSQVLGSKLSYKYQRKKIILFSVLLQSLMWLVILGLGILVWKEIINGYAASILVVLYCVYAIIGNISGPSWFSLMGELVPSRHRGEYFSRRNKIISLITLIATLISAIFLDYMKGMGLVIAGFAGLFLIAFLGRFVSFLFFTKHYYPKNKAKKDSYFSFLQFIKRAPGNNFGKFVIFVGLINLATNLAAPFFAVYMLNELHYSYVWFTLVNLSSTIFTIWSIPLWGKIGDRFGNKKLLEIGGLLIPFAPLLWIFSGNPIYLILTAQLVAGVGWSAFNLASSNFIYDSVTPQRRGICVAYFNMINGIGVFAGAMLGGLFAQYVSVSFMNTFLLIFLISAVLRGIVVLIFTPRIKEVRQIDDAHKESVFKYIVVSAPRPFYGMLREVLSVITLSNRKSAKSVTNR